MPIRYPPTVALVEGDTVFAGELHRTLQDKGSQVAIHVDFSSLLSDRSAFSFDCYVLDAELSGIKAEQVMQVLRKRANAGMVVLAPRWDSALFEAVLGAGADMLLTREGGVRAVAIAVMAVYRRTGDARQQLLNGTPDRPDRAAKRRR